MRRLTNDQFKVKLFAVHDNQYIPLANYQNYRTKIPIYHVDCGRVFYSYPNTLLGSKSTKPSGCPYCGKLKRNLKNTKSNKEWLKQVQDLVGNEYTFLESYKGNHTKIKYRHNLCGYVGYITPANFLRGHGCYRCSPTRRLTPDEFIKRVNKETQGEYQVLGTYRTSQEYIEMKHLKCGHTWFVYPVNFLNGSRCPYCNQSKGEHLVQVILKQVFNLQEDKDFIYGYVLPNKLHLDFYLPKYNIGIEYDGIQHYQSKEFFGGTKGYQTIHERDIRKNKYCKDNNITLIRIPYTVKTFGDVKKILKTYIN